MITVDQVRLPVVLNFMITVHVAIYRHHGAPGQGSGDPHFAGYGETVTAEDGSYGFLTIVPVAYPGRPPHIHVKV